MSFKSYDTGNTNGNYTKTEYTQYNGNSDGTANSNENTNSYNSFNYQDTQYELNNEEVIRNNNSLKSSKTTKGSFIKKLSTLILVSFTGGSLVLTGTLFGVQATKLSATITPVQISANEIVVNIDTKDDDETLYKVVCESKHTTTYKDEEVDLKGDTELTFKDLKPNTTYKIYILSKGILIATRTFKTLDATEDLNFNILDNKNLFVKERRLILWVKEKRQFHIK